MIIPIIFQLFVPYKLKYIIFKFKYSLHFKFFRNICYIINIIDLYYIKYN